MGWEAHAARIRPTRRPVLVSFLSPSHVPVVSWRQAPCDPPVTRRPTIAERTGITPTRSPHTTVRPSVPEGDSALLHSALRMRRGSAEEPLRNPDGPRGREGDHNASRAGRTPAVHYASDAREQDTDVTSNEEARKREARNER
jgi:hypothetical protein